MQAYVQLLRRYPEFTKLWIAQVISLFGDWFNFIALQAMVNRYAGESAGTAVSALLLARVLPPLIASPLAGVLADRFDRRRILIISDLLRGLIGISLLFADSPERWGIIYLATICQFVLSAIFEPARGALVPILVPQEHLLTANTLSNATWSVLLAVGAAAGGLIATLFGITVALTVDALSFGLSAVFIARIRMAAVPNRPEKSPQNRAQTGFLDGVRYVLKRPGLLAALSVKFGLSMGSVDALMSIYGTYLFVIGINGTGSLGILYCAFGIGAVAGPLLLNRYNNGLIPRMRRLLIVSFAGVTVGWLLLGLSPALWVAALAILVRAMAGSATWTYSSTILQLSADDAYMGRVFSLDWIGYYAAVTVSTLVTGLLIDSYGTGSAPAIAIGSGVISLIPLGIWILTTQWLERHEARAAVALGD